VDGSSIIPYSGGGTSDFTGEDYAGLAMITGVVSAGSAAYTGLNYASLIYGSAFPYATAAIMGTVEFFYGYVSPPSASWDFAGAGSFLSGVSNYFPIDTPPFTRLPDTSGDFSVNIRNSTISGADPFSSWDW
jgi:hypothetical protein